MDEVLKLILDKTLMKIAKVAVEISSLSIISILFLVLYWTLALLQEYASKHLSGFEPGTL